MQKEDGGVIIYSEVLDPNPNSDEAAQDYFEYIFEEGDEGEGEDGAVETIEDKSQDNKNFPTGLPITANPNYPRIYIGETTGRYENSAYKDDNISATWDELVRHITG